MGNKLLLTYPPTQVPYFQGTPRTVLMSFGKFRGLLMEEEVSGLFTTANLRSTSKQAQEGEEPAGDIHAIIFLPWRGSKTSKRSRT